jgi:hypothetical protein
MVLSNVTAPIRRLNASRADDKCQNTVPLFASLLSLPLDDGYPRLDLTPEQLKEQTADAIVTLTLEEAVRKPLLEIWEDVHWADPSPNATASGVPSAMLQKALGLGGKVTISHGFCLGGVTERKAAEAAETMAEAGRAPRWSH